MSPRVNLIQDTAANFAAKNPILRAGDMGIETDTGLSKFGDGINSWAALPYYPYDQSSGLFRNQLATSSGSVLGTIAGRVHPAEQLLKEAVWWIDAKHSSASGQSVSNLGWGGSALNAQLGSTSGADSNDPLYLAWAGENYVYLPGVAFNFLSVPDEAALDITGDLDIRVKVAMDDWTPSEFKTLVNKRNNSTSEYSYLLNVAPSGVLELAWSVTGTVFAGARSSTVATGISDGAVKWVRATLDVDNGAGGHDAKFFLSDDGVTWTQLGSTVTTAGTTSIYSSSAQVVIGSGQSAGNVSMVNGKIYRAIVKNGIDGPSVLDIDCSQITSGGATSFRALTGQTVTINRSTSGRKSVAVTQPCWLFGTDDYMETPDLPLLEFSSNQSYSLLAVNRLWATPVTSGVIMSSKNSLSASDAGYMMAVNSLRGYAFVSGDGIVQPSADSAISPVGSNITVAAVRDVAADSLIVYTNAGVPVTVNDSTTESIAGGVLRVGRRSGNNFFYQDFEGIAFAVFRRALTPGEITLITSYYQSRN